MKKTMNRAMNKHSAVRQPAATIVSLHGRDAIAVKEV
jgi:hypothetical protein